MDLGPKNIPNAASATLMPIIKRKVVPDPIVYLDCWQGYNVPDVSKFKRFEINHSKLFVDKHSHINGIEKFWSQTKRHMRKFNGVQRPILVYICWSIFEGMRVAF